MNDFQDSTALSSATDTHAQPPAAQQETAAPEGNKGSVADALDRAMQAVDARNTGGNVGNTSGTVPATQNGTTPQAQDRPRDAQGRFAPQSQAQDGQQAQQAPDQESKEQAVKDINQPLERLSQDVKEAWQQLPDNVRGEFHRLHDELLGGLEKYKSQFEPYQELDATLKANGQTIDEVIGHYTGIENLLAQNPLAGFKQIAENLQIPLETIATQALGFRPEDARVLQAVRQGHLRVVPANQAQQGQQAPQQAPQGQAGQQQQPSQPAGPDPRDMQIQRLEQQIQQLTGHFQQSQKQQQLSAAEQQIEAFKSSGQAPRFDELAPQITQLLTSGMAQDLSTAYQMADRLSPAQQSAQTPAQQPVPQQQQQAPAQTRDPAAYSVTGTPYGGSNPQTREPSKSAKDAVAKAFQSAF